MEDTAIYVDAQGIAHTYNPKTEYIYVSITGYVYIYPLDPLVRVLGKWGHHRHKEC